MALLGALIVLGALLAMASGRVPAALALATALALAGVTGVTPAADLAAGLSNSGVITSLRCSWSPRASCIRASCPD